NKTVVVDRFFHLLLNSFKSGHTVNYYAARLYVTPEVLNKSVKEVCGQSARKLINSFLIQEAKWLLKDYSLTINDISDELGFSSLSIFSKFFKKNTGYSPFTFRNNPQNN